MFSFSLTAEIDAAEIDSAELLGVNSEITKWFPLTPPLPAIPSTGQIDISFPTLVFPSFLYSLTRNLGTEWYRPYRFSLVHKGGRPEPSSLQAWLYRQLFLLTSQTNCWWVWESERTSQAAPSGLLLPHLLG